MWIYFLEEGEWGGFPRQRPVQLSCCILHLLVMPMETLEVTEVKNKESRNEIRCFFATSVAVHLSTSTLSFRNLFQTPGLMGDME